MHIAGGGELASEGAAEGVRGVEDGAAPAGSWQGWPGVDLSRGETHDPVLRSFINSMKLPNEFLRGKAHQYHSDAISGCSEN